MLEKLESYFERIPWLSLLVLAILISPAFFTNPKVVKKATVKKISQYLTVIPVRAVTLTDVDDFSNQELTQKKMTIPEKTDLQIVSLDNSGRQPVFELSDGTYIVASGKSIGSDVTLTEENLSTTVYLTNAVNVLYNPFTTFDTEVYQVAAGNQALQAMKVARTHWGKYYEISFDGGRTGWVDASSVSLENPKFKALQSILSQKYGSNANLSITVKQLDSNFTDAVNPNKEIYAASLWKLPILYWTQKQLNDGNASLSDQLKYISDVNNTSWYAFDPSGTGSMPKTADNQNYQLADLINRTAKESDNVASNMLAYYETDKFSKAFQTEINKIAGSDWSDETRNADSGMVANVLQALYNEGGASFNALFGTSYDNSRIEAGVPSNIRVAHKIGITDTENHDAAIVFTNQPYILVVMTTGSQPDSLITDVSQTVYEALQ